jgi:hypothetical protein
MASRRAHAAGGMHVVFVFHRAIQLLTIQICNKRA